MPKKVTTAKRVSEEEIIKTLTEAALRGHKETCPLCGTIVVSVALHFLTCSKLIDTPSKP